MRKKRLTFYCITLMLFCQDLLRKSCQHGVASKAKITIFALLVSLCGQVLPVSAVTNDQKKAVAEHCDSIKEVLKNVQKDDSRARVYIGGHYETILTKYITPLNVRLVENNLSTASLVENQNDLAEAKTLFANDFIGYQQDLEELITMDCKSEPEAFYNKLVKVRQKRKIVEQDTLKMRGLLSTHLKLAEQLKGKM